MASENVQISRSPSRSAEPLGASARRDLANLVRERGENEALALTGLSRGTLGRALAGLSIHRGTAALVERALQGR